MVVGLLWRQLPLIWFKRDSGLNPLTAVGDIFEMVWTKGGSLIAAERLSA
jgi:hypothetical protein